MSKGSRRILRTAFEALPVIDGRLLLQVPGETIDVAAGQLYLAQAGTPHAVLPGSYGTLVIVDV